MSRNADSCKSLLSKKNRAEDWTRSSRLDFSARLRIASAFPRSRTLSKAFHLAAEDNATFQDNATDALFISNQDGRRRMQTVAE